MIQSVCFRAASCLALACCFTSAAVGQNAGSELTYTANPANLPEAIARVRSGDYYGIHVNTIAHLRATEQIPLLEREFVRRKDENMKSVIASALVRLGDKNDTYWHFLVNLALPVVVSDQPGFYIFDKDGNSTGGPSPELVAWAKRHNVPIDVATTDSVYGIVEGLGFLAETGDPRGIPLLRRALKSPNPMVVQLAAEGLAEAQDKGSIPLIAAACAHQPKVIARDLATALMYFDDPTAKQTASNYLPADRVEHLKQDRAARKTPFNW